MDIDNRIPILVKVQSEIDMNGKSMTEPKVKRCWHCGGNLFYIGNVFGLIKRDWTPLDGIKGVGETIESKKYRRWDIDEIAESRFCAMCGKFDSNINVYGDEEIAHDFDDVDEKDYYEKALDILKYPKSATQDGIHRYDNAIESIKKWIKSWEEKEVEKIMKRKEEENKLLKKESKK